ncbi:kinase-like domain-containing protein, partial [Fomitopsis serialis]|uniref:kinase-like domain-containing protein n=1 Tax=Fomitopsis serialis TaxID=139415 RepID=UPI00200818AA
PEDEQGFYNYNTGTWLYNRKARTSNRVFVAKLDNGKEIVARLPFPMAGPARLTTASEVATMEFARMRMNTPTPIALDYSTDASKNEVGSEFIIMEKVPGVQLYSKWNDDLPIDVFSGFTRDLVKTERSWADARLPYIGSLYFAKDLPKNTPSFGLPIDYPHHGQWGPFVIGPSVARKFWRGGRAQLSVDRGPWKDIRSQISAIVRCEIEWLRRYAKPLPRHSPLYRSERENSPETHIDVLQRCLQIIPFLPDRPEFSTFCVWHPDLHPSNIMVDDGGPLTPSVFLDWQTATVETLVDIPMPPFLSFTRGKYIEAEYGPSRPPSLPDVFNELPEHEQHIALTEQRLAARSQ